MAQISILVPPRGKLTEMSEVYLGEPFWKWKDKKQTLGSIIAVVDDDTDERQELLLKASEQPHVIELQPGHHTLAVYDIDGDKKAMVGNLMKGAFTFGVSMMGGSLSDAADAVSGGLDRSNAKRDKAFAKNSCAEFDLADSQTIAFKCQVTAKGIVKLSRIEG